VLGLWSFDPLQRWKSYIGQTTESKQPFSIFRPLPKVKWLQKQATARMIGSICVIYAILIISTSLIASNGLLDCYTLESLSILPFLSGDSVIQN
jgi:hypothetical protein